jgi:hypothetical protein
MLKVDYYWNFFFYTKIGFLPDVYWNENWNYFIEKLFTKTDFTFGLYCLILGPIFWGIMLIVYSTIFDFFLLKYLSLCPYVDYIREYFMKKNHFFLPYLLYVELYVWLFSIMF